MSAQIIKETPTAQAGVQPPTAESLGWQLRGALPPLKLHSVSLYDPQGEVLWLSEGALGPDEQAFVVEALQVLADQRSAGHCERDFGDGRGAAFLAIRSPQAELVGLAMVVVDVKALSAGGLGARVLSAPVRALLQKLAIFLRPSGRAAPIAIAASTAAPTPAETSAGTSSATGLGALEILEWTAAESSVDATERDSGSASTGDTARINDAAGTNDTARTSDTARSIDATLAPQRVDDILTFEAEDSAPAVRTAGDVPVARAAGELHVQELAKLRPGGRMRRFRILPRPPLTLEQSLLAPLRELGAWLGAHPQVQDGATLHFSLAVSAGALADDGLPQALTECVASSGIEPACLGFELAEAACVRDRERAERLVRAIERLGCFLVLDDFSFETRALEMLRSRALRLLKVDGALTRAALRDKLSQARVIAISQAARVLGVHCAAKHIDSAAAQRWLAAAGFDFAEGPLFGPPRMLDSLAGEMAAAQ